MLKQERHKLILQIISSEPICTQEDLKQRLADMGEEVTQATLSRDIHELNLSKRRNSASGKMCYFSPAKSTYKGSIFNNAIERVDYAGNIAVIHCRSGMAGAICAELDENQYQDVVGTIAGDDTVFVLLRTEAMARNFAKSFTERGIIHAE